MGGSLIPHIRRLGRVQATVSLDVHDRSSLGLPFHRQLSALSSRLRMGTPHTKLDDPSIGTTADDLDEGARVTHEGDPRESDVERPPLRELLASIVRERTDGEGADLAHSLELDFGG